MLRRKSEAEHAIMTAVTEVSLHFGQALAAKQGIGYGRILEHDLQASPYADRDPISCD